MRSQQKKISNNKKIKNTLGELTGKYPKFYDGKLGEFWCLHGAFSRAIWTLDTPGLILAVSAAFADITTSLDCRTIPDCHSFVMNG